MAGHGGHWSCFGDDIESIIDEMVRTAADDGDIIFQRPVTATDADTGVEREETLYALTYPDTDLRILALVMTDATRQENVLISAYPFAVTAVPSPVTIQEIRVWDNRVEAQIIGRSPGDAILTFFDTMYFKDPERYRVGQTMDFHLSALAYHMEPAGGQTIKFTDEKLLRALRGERAGLNPNQPIEIPLDGAAIIFPHSEGDVDDYNYHVPVQDVQTFDMAGHVVHRLKTTLLRMDPPIETFLYAPAYVLKDGYVPKPDDDVAGAMWLQGFPAD